MYKSRLQELCQSKKWPLPKYTTVKEGRPHEVRFLSTVSVRGQDFVTPTHCRSGKEAENTAAEIAYQHLYSSVTQYGNNPAASPNLTVQMTPLSPETVLVSGPPVEVASPPPSALPIPKPRLLGVKTAAHPNKPNNGKSVPKMFEGTAYKSGVNSVPVDFPCNKEMLQNYKSLLEEYSSKNNLDMPIYVCAAEGPMHARRFRSKVSLNGKSFGALESFTTVKEAEQAAAKVAFQDLLVNLGQEDGWHYKSLLQEFAQKMGLCPIYETSTHGKSHAAVFRSVVNIGTSTFQGGETKTKKRAEMNAAKVAYFALIGDSRTTDSSKVPSDNQSAVVDNLTPAIKPKDCEDYRTTDSSKVSSDNQSAVVDNVTPDIMGKNCEGPSQVNVPSSDPQLPHDGVDNPDSGCPIGLLGVKACAHPNKPNNGEPVPKMFEETAYKSGVNSVPVDFPCNKEMLQNYKSLLQEYSQKNNLDMPIYVCEAEGPMHARRFRSKVSLNGKSFGALESFTTVKEAEQAAAKVAFQDLSVNLGQEDGWPYKSLLQEFAQKRGRCPIYETSTHGKSHAAVFRSIVNIGTSTFQGGETKTKKRAEMNAAKVAYFALIGDSRNTDSSKVPSDNRSAVVDNVTPALTPKDCEDSRTTDSSNVSSDNQSAVVDNVTPDIKGPSQVNVPSSDPQLPHDGVDNPNSVCPKGKQRAKNMYSSKRTVILSRKTRLPLPHGSDALPISDEKWVAFKT